MEGIKNEAKALFEICIHCCEHTCLIITFTTILLSILFTICNLQTCITNPFEMKHLKTLLLFFPVTLFSQGYTYIPFPKNNAIWKGEVTFLTQGIERYDVYYYLSGDTLIRNKQYKKLHIYYPSSRYYSYDSLEYLGGIREASRKIYYLGRVPFEDLECSDDITDTSEILLYDFNVKLDDTLEINGHCRDEVVSKMDISDLYNRPRKSYELTRNNSDIWIEGIGSYNDLFFPIYAEFEVTFELQCFKENVTNFNLINCTSSIPGKNKYDNRLDITFYKDHFLITNEHINDEQITLQITDMQGRVLVKKNMYNSSGISINNNLLIKGVNIITLQSKHGVYTGKILNL